MHIEPDYLLVNRVMTFRQLYTTDPRRWMQSYLIRESGAALVNDRVRIWEWAGQ